MKYLNFIKKVTLIIAKEFDLPLKDFIWSDTVAHPHDGKNLWGVCFPTTGKIYVAVADRHYLDIVRTASHELAHLKIKGHKKDFVALHKRLHTAMKNKMGNRNLKILKKAGKQKHLIFCEEQK